MIEPMHTYAVLITKLTELSQAYIHHVTVYSCYWRRCELVTVAGLLATEPLPPGIHGMM